MDTSNMEFLYNLKYIDGYAGDTTISVSIDADSTVGQALDAFKLFLRHAGYDHATVDRITLDGNKHGKES